MTDKKFETKRQHYVPRLLLRKFSDDGKSISLAMLDSGKIVSNASIKGQCYEDYFYGDDGVMEKSFEREETLVGGYFAELSAARLESLGHDVHDNLRRFVHYQHMRTLAAATALSDGFSAFIKTAFAPALESHGLPHDALDHVRIELTNPQSEVLWSALCSTPLLEDLAVRFIMTSGTTGFVISDHPVVAYNQFAQMHPKFRHYPFTTGLPDKGLQMFLPLSPHVVLAVYDPGTYESSASQIVSHASKEDVELLNMMQALNGLECLYFNEKHFLSRRLRKLLRGREAHGRAGEARATAGEMRESPDGTMRQTVVTMRKEIRLGAGLSCFRTTDSHLYEGYDVAVLPARSPELVAFTEFYRARQNARVDSERARLGLPPMYGKR
jgi:hypothetical protein